MMDIMHVVLGDNKYTRPFVERLAKNENRTITVIDTRYKGLSRHDGVVYTNIDYIRGNQDLPWTYVFYAYLDARDRKEEGEE